ncbi:MAG TPA: hypothetical protein VNT55_19155, partial [Baekduia sp.]|nr:hypothetical protein [Baekduia sp.]
ATATSAALNGAAPAPPPPHSAQGPFVVDTTPPSLAPVSYATVPPPATATVPPPAQAPAPAPTGAIPDEVIWMILKIVSLVFALIALVLAAESI